MTTAAKVSGSTRAISRKASWWRIAMLFRTEGLSEWEPWNAAYSMSRTLEMSNQPWTCCASFHVIGHARSCEVRASLTLWPKGVLKPARKHRFNEYDRITAELLKIGYAGRWQESPQGRFGDFWKHLKNGSTSKIRREARIIEAFLDEVTGSRRVGARIHRRAEGVRHDRHRRSGRGEGTAV